MFEKKTTVQYVVAATNRQMFEELTFINSVEMPLPVTTTALDVKPSF